MGDCTLSAWLWQCVEERKMTLSRGMALAWAASLLAGSLLVADTAQAGRRHGCNNACAVPACTTAEYAAPCVAPQPVTVTKTIMVPQTVYETMTVPVTVYKPVTKTKTVTVYRDVPQTREVKRMVTQYVHVPKTRTETYVVCTPTWKEVTRDVVVNTYETVAKEGVRQVCRPVMTTETRTICKDMGAYECRSYVDCCGCTRTCQVWVPNVVQQEVQIQVCRQEVVNVPFTYNVTVCKPVTQTKTFRVQEMVQEQKTREVNFTVCEAQQVEKTFTETYCQRVAEERTINYVVNEASTEQREVKVAKCIMVPKEVTYTIYPNGCTTCK
jgi:hypothetical protein